MPKPAMSVGVNVATKDSGRRQLCAYVARYLDMNNKNKETSFECKEKPIPSGYCIFHDPTYYQKEPEKLVAGVEKKINEYLSQKKKEPLFFIGYNIPFISFSKDIPSNVYFTNAKFHGTTNFTAITFNKIDFSKSTFHGIAFFNKTRFQQRAVFSFCQFMDEVYFSGALFRSCSFYKATFNKKTLFQNTRFFRENEDSESNFAYCKFINEGEVFFIRSAFKCLADFENASFTKAVIFQNSTFLEGVNFRDAEFSDLGALYIQEIFCLGNASFFATKFNANVATRFIKSNFQSADFSYSTFKSDIIFRGDKLGETTFAYCNFDGKVWYECVDFQNNVRFDMSRFTAKSLTVLSLVHFSGDCDFSYVKFEGDVFFMTVEFDKGGQFNNIQASEDSVLTFSESTFTGETTFADSIFHADVLFTEKTIFQNLANFDGGIFDKELAFHNSIFKNRVTFQNATFNGRLSFEETEFGDKDKEKEISFEGARFYGKADFHNRRFIMKVNFRNTTFAENSTADFNHILFDAPVDFSNSHCVGNSILSFEDAEFNNTIDFHYVIIDSEINFDRCKFHYNANFNYSRFHDVRFLAVDFNEASFRGVHFTKTLFNEVNFHCCVVFKQALFETATFVHTTFFKEADFSFVTFKSGDNVLFDIEDLSNISFVNSDITRVHFREDAGWWGVDEEQFKIIDERKLEELKPAENRGIRIGAIISIYRNLRENYEYWLRHEEANEFYKREMEVQRKYSEPDSKSRPTVSYKVNGLWKRTFSLTNLYRLASSYGLNYKGPVLIAIAIIGSSIIFSLLQSNSVNHNIDFSSEGIANATSIIRNDTSYMLNIQPNDLNGYIMRVIVFTILGALFFSALKAKFMRKSRK